MTDLGRSRTRHEMTMDLPAVHRAVRIARNVVRHFARLQGIADREVDYVILVVSELLANVIDHGGGGAALTEEAEENGARMQMAFVIEGDEWRLNVTDHGGGDADELRALCAAEGTPDLEDDRGRGLFLLAQMVDRLDVEANEGGDGITFRARRRFES